MLRLVGRRLGDVNLLETAHQSLRPRKVPVIFLIGGRADKADVARFEIRLQHVRGVHRPLVRSASPHQGVYLVDVDNVLVALLHDTVHNLLDAVLKVATILRTRQQCTDVELVDVAALQSFRHASLLNHPCQSPYEGRLSHTGLTHVQRIVLVAPAKHLDGALQLLLAPYQWVVLLVELVHTRHQLPPGGLRLLFARLLLHMVIIFVGTYQITQELTVLTVQRILQQIRSPRLVQTQDTHHQVRDVYRRGTAVHHLTVGILHHLLKQFRRLWFILLTLRHLLLLHDLYIHKSVEQLRTIVVAQRLYKSPIA